VEDTDDRGCMPLDTTMCRCSSAYGLMVEEVGGKIRPREEVE
jgi:hypothetical protein